MYGCSDFTKCCRCVVHVSLKNLSASVNQMRSFSGYCDRKSGKDWLYVDS